MAPLVLASPLVLGDPTWLRTGSFAALCTETKSAVLCGNGARVTCTGGMVTDVLACASMGMVCAPDASGAGECVRPACAVGARVQCHDGFLDACNDSRSETARARCPNDAPCRDDGQGGFTCTVPSACDEVRCEGGVAELCVAGERRAVQCALSGWDCPAPSGLSGLPPAPCSLPKSGQACEDDDQPSCEGTHLRYCLGGHARTFDCATTGLACREDVARGAGCVSG